MEAVTKRSVIINDPLESSYPSDFGNPDPDLPYPAVKPTKYNRTASTEERLQLESAQRERVRSLLRKMDIQDQLQLEGLDKLEFEENQKGWDLLLRMIKNRTQDNRAWKLVNRIKEVRRMYFNLIKKSNNMNQQIIVQTRTENRRKGHTGMIDSVQMVNPNFKEEGSSDTSDEEEEAANA